MKQSKVVVALFGFSLLAIWVFTQTPTASSQKAESDSVPIEARYETTEMLESVSSENAFIPVMGTDVNVAPVFDSTGAVVSDPSGTILNASHSGDVIVPVTDADAKIAPIFDSTGAVVSDPSGMILNASHSGDVIVPVTDADAKIAPIFDSTGTVVSDPTGTVSNATNP